MALSVLVPLLAQAPFYPSCNQVGSWTPASHHLRQYVDPTSDWATGASIYKCQDWQLWLCICLHFCYLGISSCLCFFLLSFSFLFGLLSKVFATYLPAFPYMFRGRRLEAVLVQSAISLEQGGTNIWYWMIGKNWQYMPIGVLRKEILTQEWEQSSTEEC